MVRLGKLSEGPILHTTMSEGPNFGSSFLKDKTINYQDVERLVKIFINLSEGPTLCHHV